MKRTVLLVEDDKLFATIHADALRSQGCTVIFAEDGEEGLKKAQTEKPDVIVLDIGLPKKDGFQVLKELRASEEAADTPVIMYSRLSSREDVNQALELGANEYLIKSQHAPEELAEHVRRLASRRAGFTSVQRLLLFGALCILLGITFYQYRVFRDRSSDAETLLRAEKVRAGFLAASQDEKRLDCRRGDPISSCAVLDGGEAVTAMYLPRTLFADEDPDTCEMRNRKCELTLDVPDDWSGDPRAAGIRFYQIRARDDREGGKRYTLGADGVIR